MEIPGALSERFPVPRCSGVRIGSRFRAPLFFGWLAFYLVLIGNAALGGHLFQLFDLVFIPIHEGGALSCSEFFGEWITVAGGTLLRLFAPFALAVYFAFRRQVPGTTFSAFFFFEQFLPIGIYMADALCQCLEYVTVGDSDAAEHDWFYLFSHAGVVAARHADRWRLPRVGLDRDDCYCCMVCMARLAECGEPQMNYRGHDLGITSHCVTSHYSGGATWPIYV